jgi:putative flippase GtrA
MKVLSLSRTAFSQLRQNPQFVRFLVVGVLNTIFGFGCFALFVGLGLHYTAALACSTICGVVFNFKTLGALVFRSNENWRIFRFIAVYFLIYFFNAAGIYLIGLCGGSSLLGGALMLLPAAFLGYLLQKRFVFKA